jgi:hypothetical protein
MNFSFASGWFLQLGAQIFLDRQALYSGGLQKHLGVYFEASTDETNREASSV